ncbi:MAG: pyruvate kinase [Gammaproteobacteria bacterium]|nr:pyruvate kinase [Gammaproteobacteria bacterium]
MLRRTKILATLGPATDQPGMIEKLVKAGVDVVRINFSHGAVEEHTARVEAVRAAAAKLGREVGVLVDLQGPKIRIDRFANGKVDLAVGSKFILDAKHDSNGGNQERVGLAYKELPNDVKSGDVLLLDDGRIVMKVDAVKGSEVHCEVVHGGILSDRKGINLQGGGLSAAALTDKDKADIITGAKLKADYMAVSFPRSAADMHEARKLLLAAGGHASLVAKIERAEALDVLDEIIEASDAVMVARGDLGVEIGDAELPAVQKHLISRSRELNRVVITATQMMESMIYNPIPTRAEVFDVANAVLDGTDAVMLSAETASGKYPDKAVEAMSRVCIEAEKQVLARTSDHRIHLKFSRVDESIAMAAMYVANHMDIKAIASLTESGSTPLWMSRISSDRPIYALTNCVETRRKVTLYRGVYPVDFSLKTMDHAQVNKDAIEVLKKQGAVKDGDLAIITKGDLMGVKGGTNAMKIVCVGDMA